MTPNDPVRNAPHTGLGRIVLIVDTGSRLDAIVRIRASLTHEHATIISVEDYVAFFDQHPIPRFASVLVHDPVAQEVDENNPAYWRAVQSSIERYDLDVDEFDEHVAYWNGERPASWMGNGWLDTFDEKVRAASQLIERTYANGRR